MEEIKIKVSLSEWCKGCPRGGATGGYLFGVTFSKCWTGFQPKMTKAPYRFLNF